MNVENFLYDSIKKISRIILPSIEINGSENISELSVLVSNHQSRMDPSILMEALDDRISFLSSHSGHLNNSIIGKIIEKSGHAILECNGKEIMKKIKQKINNRHIGLFPEGSRSIEPYELLPFKRGFYHIAKSTNRPIIPIGIQGTGLIWPKGSSFPKTLNGHVKIIFGKPINPKNYKVNECLEYAREQIEYLMKN